MIDEKESEKESEKEEKWTEHEKHRGNPFYGVGWGLILILAGLIIWGHINYPDMVGENWWAWAFLGVGAIILCLNVARWFVPEYRRSLGGPVILALIFMFIGLHGLDRLATFWFPLFLVVVGICVIIYAIAHRR